MPRHDLIGVQLGTLLPFLDLIVVWISGGDAEGAGEVSAARAIALA